MNDGVPLCLANFVALFTGASVFIPPISFEEISIGYSNKGHIYKSIKIFEEIKPTDGKDDFEINQIEPFQKGLFYLSTTLEIPVELLSLGGIKILDFIDINAQVSILH